MPAADPRLQQLVGGALALQLTAAAAAVALLPLPASAGAVRPAPVAAAAALPVPVPVGPLALAGDLWEGQVPLAPLGTDAAGELEVPATADALGWWAPGPAPGDVGAAVVVGHVDLAGRPGTFARLAAAEVGEQVVVVRDGGPVRFRVTSVTSYAKTAFPTDAVYGPADRPVLRLVTCGGRFDPRTGHYEDNVVVVAERVG